MNRTRLSSRFATALTGAVLLSASIAGPALAYPPGTDITVEISSGGSAATVSNAQPGCDLSIYVNGQMRGSGTAGSGGTAVIDIDPPAQAGDTVQVSQSGSGCASETGQATVPGGGGDHGGGGGTTPSTGAGNTALGLAVGLGALGLGGGLVVASRRKRV